MFANVPFAGEFKTRAGDVLAQNEHLLSLKDNNQTENLEALIDAGIRSFKIEGRLKDLSYVKNVTAHYRQKLDAIMARRPEFVASSHGRCEHTFTPDPEKTFNRGSTDYFVHERSQGIKDFRSPKYIGEDVGRVVSIGKDFIQVSSTHEFNNGDGLAFFPSIMPWPNSPMINSKAYGSIEQKGLSCIYYRCQRT